MWHIREAGLRARMFVALLGIVVAFVPNLARADTVRLKNGDVITGKILAADSDNVTIDTDALEKITIETKHVASIQSDRALTVEYEDGREVDGMVTTSASGAVEVHEGAAPAAAAPAPEATALNLAGIAEIREVETYYRYIGRLDFGLNVAKGNSDSENVALSGLFQPSFGKNTIIINGQWNRTEADGELAASNWRIKGEYERDIWKGLFFLVYNGYEHDALQDLDLRISAGAGLGYEFFEPDPTLLKVSLAPSYVDENFKGTDNDRDYAALRWTLDFDQDIYSPDVSIYHSHQLVAGLTESQLVLLTQQGLRFDLIADLFLKAEFQFDYNDKPADGAKSEDYRYLLKIGCDFKGDENDWFQ